MKKVGEAYFNSTMVRLKVVSWLVFEGIVVFQFHYGTIKRLHPMDRDHGHEQFQFHYGTIKRS